jgi:Na+:H+ antiporter, NhaA family
MAGSQSGHASSDTSLIGGVLLLFAAIAALIVANSGLSQWYADWLATPLTIGVEPFALTKKLVLWINDGLMAIFFLVVGLEIKREFLQGALRHRKSAVLPVVAALGGMVVPALIYASLNWDDPAALRGWAVPAATDIAFVVGILALLASRVPAALKAFLLAVAIIDDLGAIIIIAAFYTADINQQMLANAALSISALALLNRFRVMSVLPYLAVGAVLWFFVLKSGLHPTLAGVVTALMIPMYSGDADNHSPLRDLEHALQPWVAYLIVPIFAFANAGVDLSGVTLQSLAQPIPLGIATGLFFGKAIGVFGASQLAISSRLAELPRGTSRAQLFGAAVLAGIGFTMSLFIGMLAFPDPALAADLRLGVLSGSLASAIVGALVLYLSGKRP